MKLRVLLQIVGPDGLIASNKCLLEQEFAPGAVATVDPDQLSLPLAQPKRGRGRPRKPATDAAVAAGPTPTDGAPAAATVAPSAPPAPSPSAEKAPATLQDMMDFVSAKARLIGIPRVSEAVKGYNIGTPEEPKFPVRVSDVPPEHFAGLAAALRAL